MWFSVNTASNNDVQVLEIDAGYRPYTDIYFVLCDTDGVAKIGTVTDDGWLLIYKPSAKSYYGQVTYSV